MVNPIEYLIENISWYAPIYNISWVLFIIFALVLPLLFLGVFHITPGLKKALPPRSWKYHFKTYGYLGMAALVIFAFRLIPYWIFNDKILHFLGGGIAIGLIYEYFVLNFNLYGRKGIITLAPVVSSRLAHFAANFILLTLFACYFSVVSELYEFVSKYFAGAEFDSSGLDTWVDIIYNCAGAYTGYILLWIVKYSRGTSPLLSDTHEAS